jgi:ADP-ribosylation factor-like protein 2
MGASLLVFSNKTDVAGCMSDDEIRQVCLPRSPPSKVTDMWVQGLKLDAIHTHKWIIFRCSAMTGENLREGLEWILQDARDRYFLY